jgi:HD-like signal output (HDOD) protein
LLHDIGKVVMEQYLHEDFHRALKFAQDNNIPTIDAENQVLKYNHAEVAEWLTNSWGLPIDLQLPLIFHHTPLLSAQCQDIIALCHYSDWLCYDINPTNEKYCTPELQLDAKELLKLEDKDIEDLKERLPKEMEKMIIFFDIAANA